MPIATKSSKFDISKESLTANLAKKFSKIFKKGDIIFTGTPEGVGPLKSGDRVEMGFTNSPPKKLTVI